MGQPQLHHLLTMLCHHCRQLTSYTTSSNIGIRGTIVNVPANVATIQTHLPRRWNDAETMTVVLKRKLEFKHDVMSAPVRPMRIMAAIRYLAEKPLFKEKGITIVEDWLQQIDEGPSTSMLAAGAANEPPTNVDLDAMNNAGDDADEAHPVDDGPFLDTMVTNVATAEDLLSYKVEVAPGQGQRPLALFIDHYAEELAFPRIFGGLTRRKTTRRVSMLERFKWEMTASDPRARTNSANLFFKARKQQINVIRNAAEIRVRKSKLGAGQRSAASLADPAVRAEMIKTNVAYRDLCSLRNSPHFHDRYVCFIVFSNQVTFIF